MRHEDYKNLKDEVKNKNFFNGYGGFAKLSYYVSFLGNFFSIFLAYFFINDVISQTILEGDGSATLGVIAISLAILFGVEIIKRFVFDKFSLEIIKQKFKFKSAELSILTFFSVLLIGASFYLSLNGAKEYANKDKEIQNNTEVVIDTYTDSLNVKYDTKTVSYETEVSKLREANLSYDDRLKGLDDKDDDLSNDTWQDRQEKRRIKDERKSIRDDKDRNIEQIDKLELKIKDVKEEKEKELAKFEKETIS